MPPPKSAEFSAESAAAQLALLGVDIDTARASNVAAALNLQVGGAHKAFAKLAFETEPADFLAVSAEEAK